MAMASQSATKCVSGYEQSLAAVDSLGRLAREKAWGSLTMSIPSVDVVDGGTRIELADSAGSSSYVDLGIAPDRSGVSERLPRSLSVILSHRLRSIDCVLVQLHGRSDKISFAEALSFLERGVHGVIRWEPQECRGVPKHHISSD